MKVADENRCNSFVTSVIFPLLLPLVCLELLVYAVSVPDCITYAFEFTRVVMSSRHNFCAFASMVAFDFPLTESHTGNTTHHSAWMEEAHSGCQHPTV